MQIEEPRTVAQEPDHGDPSRTPHLAKSVPTDDGYVSGYGLPADVLFDSERTRRVLENQWFFAGTRADVANPGDVFVFRVQNDEYALVHRSDGTIACYVNRCLHQSARLFGGSTTTCGRNIVCPNHQWTYRRDTGRLRAAPGMGPEFLDSDFGGDARLTSMWVREIGGLVFACFGSEPDHKKLDATDALLAPYTSPFGLGGGGYKLALHERETVDANWLLVMVNNRECMHCRINHRGLCRLFDPSSFNGGVTPTYQALFDDSVERWERLGLAWREQPFEPVDSCRVARYPMQPGFDSITFDGRPASKKCIGPFAAHDPSTLSIWLNPNAWIHFTSDHIATNWVLPIDADRCELLTSWIVRDDAVEGIDYDCDHLAEVWRVTNAEDVGLCRSMTEGARSSHYRPGPFAPDERFCRQFCDWFMRYSDRSDG